MTIATEYQAISTTRNHIEASALLAWLEIAGYDARVRRSDSRRGCWEVQVAGDVRAASAEMVEWWNDWTR